jgi:pimeloyl-ACP methyl ester carboxylesterase
MSEHRSHGVDRGQPADQLAFVVGDAAREQLAVAARQLERRRVPQLQRLGRLDIVVVVAQQRALAGAIRLAQHHRVAGARHNFGVEAARSK